MNTNLEPNVLRWARIRAGLSPEELAKRLGKKVSRVVEWEMDGILSLKQVEALAEKTHTPVGYLFLPKPPVEKLPVKDFRTVSGVATVSPNLLDVIYHAQRRQEWYRDHLKKAGNEPLPFIGSLRPDTRVETAAEVIRSTLSIGPEISFRASSWEESLELHVEEAEDAGIVVMRSSIVGNATRRAISVSDFRGFALCDKYAPVLFINTADSKAAQLFTLAHELVHLWIGESVVFNLDDSLPPDQSVERYCNSVGAELLIPMAMFRVHWRTQADSYSEVVRLGRQFKVSTLVTARRALDAGFIDQPRFKEIYANEVRRYHRKGAGGSFYRSAPIRAGRRLTRSLVVSALEGGTSYREAMQLVGVSSINTFHELAKRLGC
ncbi:MAG: XRE family transcriptional regulator [Limisphaerales bacterium]